MNALSSKKIFIPTIIIIILIIAGLFIKLTLLDSRHLLIDYLPRKTEFWFWQNKDGFKQKTVAILTQLGIDTNIIKFLQDQKDEIVIYRERGRWYKIEDTRMDKARVSIGSDDLWFRLQQNLGNDVVGFLSQDYIRDQLGNLGFIFKPASYYFNLRQEFNVLRFTLVPRQNVFKIRSIAKKSLTLPSSIVFAIKSEDSELLNNVAKMVKENIKEYIAFDYPVIISQKLPDGTWIKEKVVKPELFSWHLMPFANDVAGRDSLNIFQLGLDKTVVDQYQVADQLENIKTDLEYYQNDQSLVFGLQTADLSKNFFGKSDSFFYLSLADNASIPLVDILGKSHTLAWLQNLGFQSIIAYENNGIISGELRF